MMIGTAGTKILGMATIGRHHTVANAIVHSNDYEQSSFKKVI
jgi:serine acetyltransferase